MDLATAPQVTAQAMVALLMEPRLALRILLTEEAATAVVMAPLAMDLLAMVRLPVRATDRLAMVSLPVLVTDTALRADPSIHLTRPPATAPLLRAMAPRPRATARATTTWLPHLDTRRVAPACTASKLTLNRRGAPADNRAAFPHGLTPTATNLPGPTPATPTTPLMLAMRGALSRAKVPEEAGARRPLATDNNSRLLLAGDSKPPQPGDSRPSRPPSLAGRTMILLSTQLGPRRLVLVLKAMRTMISMQRRPPGPDRHSRLRLGVDQLQFSNRRLLPLVLAQLTLLQPPLLGVDRLSRPPPVHGAGQQPEPQPSLTSRLLLGPKVSQRLKWPPPSGHNSSRPLQAQVPAAATATMVMILRPRPLTLNPSPEDRPKSLLERKGKARLERWAEIDV